MMSFDQYLERIAAAGSTVELARLYCDHCLESLGCNSYNYMPLYQPDDPRELIQCHESVSQAEMLEMVTTMMPMMENDVGMIEAYRPRQGHVFNQNKGVADWQTIPVYHEFLRPYRIDRQMCAYICDGDLVLSVLSLSHTRKRIFNEDEERQLERITAPTERAIRSLLHAGNRATGPNQIATVLEQGLPVTACLFDSQARLQWISRPAVARLGMRATRVSGALLLGGDHRPLELLRGLARSALAAPEGALYPDQRLERALLRPGERLALRRLPAAPGRGPMVLAAIAQGPAPAALRSPGSQQLTPREREVARLAAEGYTMLNIAGRLDIREATVHTHLKHIYRKLRVANRAQLACHVLRRD
jgi:DNA-binding CsgD family transcriptional regulator